MVDNEPWSYTIYIRQNWINATDSFDSGYYSDDTYEPQSAIKRTETEAIH